MNKYLFLILTAVLIAGCLGDTINGPQIVSRPTLAPGQVFYKCITINGVATHDLRISWNPSTVDTQQNFMGYFIKLYNSAPYNPVATDGIDSIGLPIDSFHVPKSDTMHIFKDEVLQEGRYTVKVWGERFPNPKPADTVVLSRASSNLSFNFDSRPVLAPAEIYASSNSTGAVNLFWSQSPSSKQIGLAGYVIRYIDPTNSAAHLIYYSRPTAQADTSSGLIGGKYNKEIVTTPTNPSPPQEKEYTFWIKAIRKDSVESDDSISITWSGAERLTTVAKLDTGIFIGAINSAYGIQQTDPNGSNALFQVTQSGTNFVIISSKDNNNQFKTQFVNPIVSPIVSDSLLNLDRNYLSKPFAVSDFTESKISFPSNSSSNKNTIIYALFPAAGTRARLLFTQTTDTVTHLSTNQIQASFQPQETPQLPFF